MPGFRCGLVGQLLLEVFMAIERVRALRAQGEHERALDVAMELIASGEADAQLLYEAACVHDFLGREAGAIPLYVRALASGLEGDNRRNALLGLGSTYRALGHYEQALATFDTAMEQFPGAEEIGTFRAMVLHNLGRSKEAVEDLLGVVARTSADPAVTRFRRAIEFYARNIDQTWES